MTKCRYSIYDDNNKLLRKGRIRLFLPSFKNFDIVLKKQMSMLSPQEAMYVCNMLKFHMLFPPDDVISAEYIDYRKMLEVGAFCAESSNKSQQEIDDKLYHAIYKDKKFNLPMTKEAYHSFKLMALEEISDIEKELSAHMEKYFQEIYKNSTFIKKLRLKLKRKKIGKIKSSELKTVWELLNKASKDLDKDLANELFYREASELLNRFNKQKYDKLVTRLSEYFTREYEEYKLDRTLEQIEYINSAKNKQEREDVLLWIFENTSSRSDAFDLMKLDAEYLHTKLIHLYCKDYYIKTRKRMSDDEKRLFQLMYFQREAFIGRIPAFDSFFKSFWESNLELILCGLVIKKNNPVFYEKSRILAEKWEQFLNDYPYAIRIKPYVSLLKNKEKCLILAEKHFNAKEYGVISALIENHELETICACYSVSKDECRLIASRFRKVVEGHEIER